MRSIRIGLVGDYSTSVIAHKAIPLALDLAARQLGCSVDWSWIATDSLPGAHPDALERFDSLWCVPGSPYRSEAGALAAIRHARERGKPFLGTCGGCQHAILEYARNVLGMVQAEHAEANPSAFLPLIAPLSCALVEARGKIFLERDSRIRSIYGSGEIEEAYHCSFGLNPDLEHLLDGSDLRITGRDAEREARALELTGKRFYLLTQFQPERSALSGVVPPVVSAFVRAAIPAVMDLTGPGTEPGTPSADRTPPRAFLPTGRE